MEIEEPPAQSTAASTARVWYGLTLALAAYGALTVAGLVGRSKLAVEELGDPARLISLWSPIMGLGVIAIAAFIEDQPAPLRSLGLLRPTPLDVAWGMLFFAFGFVTMLRIAPVVDHHLAGIHVHLNQVPILIGWEAVVSAATMEELFFRGYLIERFERVSGSTWFAATTSLIMFAFGHLVAWGPAGVARNLIWGAFVTILYVWRRNLPACMLMHFMQDAFSIPVIWYTPLKRLF
jgi:membrane protease YdiL (CAAX protease family)